MRTKFNLGQTVFTVKRATPNTMPKIVGPLRVRSITIGAKGEACGLDYVHDQRHSEYLHTKRLFPSLRAAARELNRQLAIRAKTL